MKKNKAILIFSLIFLFLLVLGLLVFGFSFGKVPINNYALLENHFTALLNPTIFTSGVYLKGLLNTFHKFPSNMQYIIYSKTSPNGVLNLVSSDMQPFSLEYTVAYRIRPDLLSTQYQQYQNTFLDRARTVINNKIMSVLSNTNSNSLWLSSTEDKIINKIQSEVNSTFNSLYGIEIHSFWMGNIEFLNLQDYYNSAFQYSFQKSPQFANTLYQLMSINFDISTLNSSIYSLVKSIEANNLDTLRSFYLKDTNLINSRKNFDSLMAKIGILTNDSTFTQFLALRNYSRLNFNVYT